MMTFFHLSLLSAFAILSCSATEENTTLLLVQTLSRHGDRAPLQLYPTDPNGIDCWPNGLGGLTQIGKKQQYIVGKFLRSKYKDFVTSNPNQVYVNSSSEDRCLSSALSQLASFFAPDKQWKIASYLDWQPIPIHYLPMETDIYLNFKSICPRADDAFLSALNSNEIQEFYQTHQIMVEDVSNYSGLDYSNPINAFIIYDTLETERRNKLIVPEWADTYWKEMKVLHNMAAKAIYSSPRLRFGPFLGLINDNLKNTINGRNVDLKFIMNFSHDVEVAGVLLAFNYTNIPAPPFCATLLIELHEMADASMAVRLLYMNSTNPLVKMEEPHVLVLNECSEFCPVEHFMKSYEWMIPENWVEECQVKTSED